MQLLKLRNRHFFIADVLIIVLTPFLALLVRDAPGLWVRYTQALIWFIGLALAIKLFVFQRFGLYNRYWRYASMDELLSIGLAVATATISLTLVFAAGWVLGLFVANGFPRSVPLLDGMMTLLFIGGVRFSIRAVEYWRARRRREERQRVLIVGAGDAGSLIARDLRANPRTGLEPVGFVDDDPQKRGVWVNGVQVLGVRAELPELIVHYAIREVIIAMPAAPGKVIREVVALCEAAGVRSKTLPGLSELLSGQVSINRLRNVQIEDLLRRAPAQVDMNSISEMIRGRRVLVTGAGGSIGSELCRQIIRCRPAELILLGHGENSLFQLSAELTRLRARDTNLLGVAVRVVVADVRDLSRIQTVFERFRPQMVFHAAAHKHVPMMEENIEDAVTNNVLGTRNTVELSEAHGVERFVLISSDKAVNPVSIMGASKRVAEKIVGDVAQRSGLPYVAVRFGNVLGSRGSVVPVFKQQIAEGGPVTVTHPEMSRYFMTIPEAVQLVLQAAALSAHGEVFILDMGQPVKIVDLALDLIRLSGLQVGRDVDLVFTGLRPGEKLHEELFLEGEDYKRTAHDQIFAVRNGFANPKNGERAMLLEQVDRLVSAAHSGEPEAVRGWLQAIVPEYDPQGQVVTEPPVPVALGQPTVPESVLAHRP
jgi:FlaA1/EpsC-like NDP-sugar epimerase